MIRVTIQIKAINHHRGILSVSGLEVQVALLSPEATKSLFSTHINHIWPNFVYRVFACYKTSDSREFRCGIDSDWWKKMTGSKSPSSSIEPRVWQLGMRNATGSPIFPFQGRISGSFGTAIDRLWLRLGKIRTMAQPSLADVRPRYCVKILLALHIALLNCN